jgi:hypothetical protein
MSKAILDGKKLFHYLRGVAWKASAPFPFTQGGRIHSREARGGSDREAESPTFCGNHLLPDRRLGERIVAEQAENPRIVAYNWLSSVLFPEEVCCRVDAELFGHLPLQKAS